LNVGYAFNRPAFLLLFWLSFVSFEKWATQDVVLDVGGYAGCGSHLLEKFLNGLVSCCWWAT